MSAARNELKQKAVIRAEVLKKRDSIEPASRSNKDRLIKENLLSLHEFIHAEAILFFASFRSEVSTLPLIERSLETGKRIILPRVDAGSRELRLYEIGALSELGPGFMGIPEPDISGKREADVNETDIAILPGAAFDRAGNRLGYGAGYYDKLLSKLKRKLPLIALAYEEQILDRIPSEAHDVRVHIIVTDERVIRCP